MKRGRRVEWVAVPEATDGKPSGGYLTLLTTVKGRGGGGRSRKNLTVWLKEVNDPAEGDQMANWSAH